MHLLVQIEWKVERNCGLSFNYNCIDTAKRHTLSLAHTYVHTHTISTSTSMHLGLHYTCIRKNKANLNNDIKISRLIGRRKGKGSLHPLFYFFNFNGYRKLWVNYMPFYFCSKGFCSFLNQRNTTSIYRAKLHIEYWKTNSQLHTQHTQSILIKFSKNPTLIPD